MVQFSEIRDLGERIRTYLDPREALETAGLSDLAMSQENVEMVRAAIDAYNRGDWDAALKDASPDFEFDFSRAVGPLHGIFGLDQMRGFWGEFVEAWESVRLEPDELVAIGVNVVVPVTAHTRGRDGIELTSRPAYVITIRDDAIARVCMYQERADALEAAARTE